MTALMPSAETPLAKLPKVAVSCASTPNDAGFEPLSIVAPDPFLTSVEIVSVCFPAGGFVTVICESPLFGSSLIWVLMMLPSFTTLNVLDEGTVAVTVAMPLAPAASVGIVQVTIPPAWLQVAFVARPVVVVQLTYVRFASRMSRRATVLAAVAVLFWNANRNVTVDPG